MQPSKRIQSLAASQTLAMAQKSADLKAQGVDVISLAVGEPDFDTPEHIKKAAEKAIEENYSYYTPVPGYLSLRKAICESLRRDNSLEFEPQQIVVGNGAKQELCNVILSYINPGDEVIIPTPAWVSYIEMVKLAEGKAVEVYAGIDQDFKITPAQLEAAITPKTRMLLLCSPSNPTGMVYTREELAALVEVLAKYPDILIMADEIYQHINYTGEFTSMGSFPEIADRTVIINGVSKAYAMTGWRIGYCACPLWLAKAVTKLQGQYTSNASSIAQKAAEAAYSGPQECVEEMRQAFERRRDLVVGLMRTIPGVNINTPQGAFYVFPEIKAYIGKDVPERLQGQTEITRINNAGDLAIYLLEVAHVATVDGAAFGAPGYLRLSYATSDEKLKDAIERIRQALAVLMEG